MVKVHKNEVSATSDKLVSKLQREVQYLKSLLDMRRKGGMEQIHQELWSLREENEKLRSIAGGVSVTEVERLRNENKLLRVELQKLGNQTSMENSGSSFFVTAEGSKPSSAAEVMSVPEYVQARASSKEGQQPLAQDLYELMSRRGTDIQATLDALRKHDLQVAAESLKRKITNQGRCPVCTLKVPCKHYQDVSELPTVEDQENSDPTLNASTVTDKPTNPPLPEIRGRKELSTPASQRTPRPPRSGNQSVDPARPLTYRMRGVTNVPRVNPGQLVELKRTEERKSALKEAERKLATLEKLEKYREERLRKEIEKLEEERMAEEAQAQAEQAKEERRVQYLQKQKEKLVSYELQRRRNQEEAKEKAQSEEDRRKSADKKATKARQKTKAQIDNYHLKKRVLDGIISDQVQSLGNDYTEEEVIRRDKDSIQALYEANE